MSTPNLKEDTLIQKNGKNWEGQIRTLFFEGQIGPCGSYVVYFIGIALISKLSYCQFLIVGILTMGVL